MTYFFTDENLFYRSSVNSTANQGAISVLKLTYFDLSFFSFRFLGDMFESGYHIILWIFQI